MRSIQVSTAQLLSHWVAYCCCRPLFTHYNVSADRPRLSQHLLDLGADLHALFLYALGDRVRYKVNGFPTTLAIEVKPNTIVQHAFDPGLNFG